MVVHLIFSLLIPKPIGFDSNRENGCGPRRSVEKSSEKG